MSRLVLLVSVTVTLWSVAVLSVSAQTATNCSLDNGGCDHDCWENADGLTRNCSCVSGYKLHDDAKKCDPKGESSCGRTSYSKPMKRLQPRMVGGHVGQKGESPWQALLLNTGGQFFCGGVLIDENWVLTAAHCLDNCFRVRLGDYERYRDEDTEVTLMIEKTFKHPHYNVQTMDNDIALIRLQTPAPFSQYVIAICLPGREMAERVLHLNGTLTVVTGWGKEKQYGLPSSVLNAIKVPLVDRSVCARQMSGNISDNVLCAGILGQGMDACEGDGGGPMVTLYRDTWFLLGLVSWGEGCGREDKLGVYTKVSNYNQWINGVREDWDKGHNPEPPSVRTTTADPVWSVKKTH